MTKSTCLHIQDRESGPIRVVEIPWISVRIGHAAYCEVRLSERNLADVACWLKRRGKSWHLVPVATPSPVWFEGRPLDGTCLLPYDVPFHVGGYCLTLRQDQTAQPDWGMYGKPNPRPLEEARPAVDLSEPMTAHALGDATAAADSLPEDRTSEPAPPRATEGPDPSTMPNPSPAEILKHRWETRWRAAGVEIQARAAGYSPAGEPARPAYGAGFESVPLKEARIPRSGHRSAPAQAHRRNGSRRRRSSFPAWRPGVGRAFQPDLSRVGQAFPPDVRLESLTYGKHSSAMPLSLPDRPHPTPDLPPIELPRDLPECDAPAPRGAPPSFWDHWAPTEEIVDSLRHESPPPDDGGGLTEPPAAFDFPGPQSPPAAAAPKEEPRRDQPPVETSPAETLAEEEPRGDQSFAGTTTAETLAEDERRYDQPSAETATAAAAPLGAAADEGIPPSPPVRKEGKLVGSSPEQPSEPQPIRTIPTARANIPPAHGGTSSAESHQTLDGLLYAAPVVGKRAAVRRGADRASEGLYTDPDHLQWPSADEILAAHQAAQRFRNQPAAQTGPVWRIADGAREPGQWLSPAWLTGPPIALLCSCAGPQAAFCLWRGPVIPTRPRS